MGNKVLSYDYVNNELVEATILQLEKVVHSGLVAYLFENGMEITDSSLYHSYLSNNKGIEKANTVTATTLINVNAQTVLLYAQIMLIDIKVNG